MKKVLALVAPVAIAAVVALLASDNGVERGGLPVIVWCALAAFAINWLAFIPSWIRKTEHYYDLVGSLTYITVVALALVLGGGDGSTSWLVAILIWMWALRLGTFLFRRVRAAGGDRRFSRAKNDFVQFLTFWTTQGLWVFLTAAAALTAMTTIDEKDIGVLTIVGVVIWVLGITIEVQADTEKSTFRSDPANEGRFISSGIWAWSRHPNYFGEIVLWVGVAVIALPALDGWQYATLISPVFVIVLLTRVSGVPMLERRAKKKWGDDPDYQQYVESTPVLVPRPPRS